MNASRILRVDNVTKVFRQGGNDLSVLCGITQDFEAGQSYAVVGVSGSGKSTFLHILGGLDEPTSGSVSFAGTALHNLRDRSKLLNKHLGFVFQFHYLIKELTVLENVMLPGLIAGLSRAEATERAHELLTFLRIEAKSTVNPTALSGGEQQRVSIGRAMFNRPKFLIADEPTGNLDEENAQQALALLQEGCSAWGMGLIVCSHDRSVYEKMGIIFQMQHGILVRQK